MMKVVLTACSQDYDAATEAARSLRSHAISVTLPASPASDENRRQRRIEEDLANAGALLVIWSRSAARSVNIVRDITTAISLAKAIVVIQLDEEPVYPLIEDRPCSKFGSPDYISTIHTYLGAGAPIFFPKIQHLSGLREAFRTKVAERANSLRILGRGQSLPLSAAFLPLFARSMSAKSDPAVDARRLLEIDASHLVVVGPPGSGKSTLLKYLAHHCATAISDCLPYLLRIPDITSTNESIEQSVRTLLGVLIGRSNAEAVAGDDSFCRRGSVVLLDGLDEVGENEYRGFLQKLEAFRHAFPDCKLVVSCRTQFFRQSDMRAYLAFELQRLENEHIETYIKAVCPSQHQGKLYSTITGNTRLNELARTPFLLALMCSAPEAIPTRAVQRATLFSECLDFLLKAKDWDEPSQGRETSPPEVLQQLQRSLCILAVRFFKLDLSGVFSHEEVLFVLRSSTIATEPLRAEEVLDRICDKCGLLQRGGSEIYFIHRSIWEYFVARGMLSNPTDDIFDWSKMPRWEEPIRLYAGLMPESRLPVFLRELWKRNRALALRSMSEVQAPPVDVLRELVNSLDRRERVRLVFEVRDTVGGISEPAERIRFCVDTIETLVRVERDCEVLFHCIELLRYVGGDACEELLRKILDPKGAASRRASLCGTADARFEFVRIPGGEFIMGSEGRDRIPDEGPEHKVIVSGFWIGRYAVTNGAYYRNFPFAIDRRESRSSNDDQPVIFVTWYEACLFAYWLGCDLPSEAEWEYACRAGGQDDKVLFDYAKTAEYAWFIVNSNNMTHPVGQKLPNSYGLYDMLGNVREWCCDWFESSYYQQCQVRGVVRDPRGPEIGTRKVLRGGCFDWNVANLRPSYRNYNPPDNSYFVNGFRLVFRGDNPESVDERSR